MKHAFVQVWVDTKFAGVNYNNSEQFNTAGRSIGTGLMAIDLVRPFAASA